MYVIRLDPFSLFACYSNIYSEFDLGSSSLLMTYVIIFVVFFFARE